MKELVQAVKQWGIDRGLDKVGHLAQAKYTLKETAELLDAYADGDVDKINDAIGDIAVTLIVGASNDEDLLKRIAIELCGEEDFINSDSYNGDFLGFYPLLIKKYQNLFFRIKKGGPIFYSHYISCFFELNDVLSVINHKFTQSLSLKDCLQLAYNEIKDRTGKMENGQFIKD